MFQDAPVINYPNENPYTRCTEFKYLTGQEHPKTTVVYEYPRAEGDPYYPVPRPENAAHVPPVSGARRAHGRCALLRPARDVSLLQHGSGRRAGACALRPIDAARAGADRAVGMTQDGALELWAESSARSIGSVRGILINDPARCKGHDLACDGFMFAAFKIPLSWGELLKRTAKDSSDDDILGLAAQLAYYFFLALFPAVLFLLAVASFFPLTNVIDDIVGRCGRLRQPMCSAFLEEQLRRISNADSGGILTIGILGAIWSSSAAVVAIIGSLNRAYDIEEGRPWWKVRLTAIGLTIGLALLVLTSFTLIVAGPNDRQQVASSFGLGTVFEWTWKILQWPLAFLLVSTAVGLVYYFAPDAEQDWVWITPGAVIGTLLWVIVSLIFKFYVANFADYNATYGAVGGVIILMLWFYISGLAILVGAELNAEIEHASPYGKDPGEKVPGRRRRSARPPRAPTRNGSTRKSTGPRDCRTRSRRCKPHVRRRTVSWVSRSACRFSRHASGIASGEVASRARSKRTHTMRTNKDERTLGELFADLSRDTRTLVRQELQLARTELTEKAFKIGKGAGLMVGGGLIAYGGLLAIIAAMVLILIAIGLPPWAASLAGGVLVAGIGYLLVRSGSPP